MRRKTTSRLVGYARVSTGQQDLQLQLDALKAAGVTKTDLCTDKISGSKAARPGLDACLQQLQAGDTLLVSKAQLAGWSERRQPFGSEINRTPAVGASRRSVSRVISTTLSATCPRRVKAGACRRPRSTGCPPFLCRNQPAASGSNGKLSCSISPQVDIRLNPTTTSHGIHTPGQPGRLPDNDALRNHRGCCCISGEGA
ncbi:MAG: recombinase family protein [Verrucomicrobiota bacterium]